MPNLPTNHITITPTDHVSITICVRRGFDNPIIKKSVTLKTVEELNELRTLQPIGEDIIKNLEELLER